MLGDLAISPSSAFPASGRRAVRESPKRLSRSRSGRTPVNSAIIAGAWIAGPASQGA